jgi:hypothetical protein
VQKRFLDDYKGIHLALEVKYFIGSLSLRRIPVWDPTIGSLDLPLVATIVITEREREIEITCKLQTRTITKKSLSNYAQ